MPRRALVIDDDDEIRTLAAHLLSQRDYQVDAVGGLDELARGPERMAVDLILLDFALGEFDGFDVLQYLHDLRLDASIVLLSACADDIADRVIQAGRKKGLGMLGFLPKRRLLTGLDQLLEPLASRPRQLAIEDLVRALSRNEFFLVYQPKFDLRRERVTGAEALLRWQTSDHGTIAPDLFIPLAERHGFIVELTWRVLTLAFDQLARWHANGWALNLAVNIPSAWIQSADVLASFDLLAEARGAPLRHLTLEVTESTGIECLSYAAHILRGLRERGCRLSLDDFGTGYSSMTQLHRLAFDELKLDRSFVSRADQDPVAEAITLSILDLGHRLHMKVVAEGVETQTQYQLLRHAGCDIAQGYWLGRPMPGSAFETWYRSSSALAASG